MRTKIPRILWSAKDGPWLASGYGVMGKHLLPRFAKKYGKKNILIFAPVFQQYEIREWEGMTCLPGLKHDFGEEMIESHVQNHDVTFVLQVGDWFPLKVLPQLAAQDRVLWVQWAPMDWMAVPKDYIQGILKPAWRVVPWNRYAQKMFQAAELPNVTEPIPLGLETSLWRHIDRSQLPESMKSLGFSEQTFNILIVGANQRRKYWQEQLEGISVFRKANPQVQVRLYFHTTTETGGESDLKNACQLYGLGDIVLYPDQYVMANGGLTEEQMVRIFNCGDVVLNASHEGFGFSMAQAQAVGVPVIALDDQASTEIVSYGAHVPSMGFDHGQQWLKPIPSPIGIAQALEHFWSKKNLPWGENNERAIRHIQENFSWDLVASKWFALIEELMAERESHSMYIPSPSKMLRRRANDVREVS